MTENENYLVNIMMMSDGCIVAATRSQFLLQLPLGNIFVTKLLKLVSGDFGQNHRLLWPELGGVVLSELGTLSGQVNSSCL